MEKINWPSKNFNMFSLVMKKKFMKIELTINL